MKFKNLFLKTTLNQDTVKNSKTSNINAQKTNVAMFQPIFLILQTLQQDDVTLKINLTRCQILTFIFVKIRSVLNVHRGDVFSIKLQVIEFANFTYFNALKSLLKF